jgi:hypothetical protein
MAVQRLPDPGLMPTSQEAGGTVHSNALAQTAPGSMPGFEGGLMTYPVSTDSPGPMSGNQDDRRPVDPSGAMSGSQDSPFPQAASFAQSDNEDSNAARWKKTPSSS